MNIDLWETDRNEATTLDNGLKVRKSEHNGRFNLEMWRPKATKPFANYFFRTPEAREKYVQEQVDGYNTHLERKEQEKKNRVTGDPSLADPGAIFVFSYGYDQTNVHYFQVTKRKGLSVTVAAIACETVPGSEGFDCDRVRPVPDAFIERCGSCRHSENAWCHRNAAYGARESYNCTCTHYKPARDEQTKRLQFSNGQPYVRFSCGYGRLVRVIRFGNAEPLATEGHFRSWYH